MKKRWFEDESFWVDMAPKIFTGKQWNDASDEARAAMSLAGVEAPARVVDFACGVGRHSIALARLGYEVTGVDTCRRYLDVARDAADAAQVQVRFLRQDMRWLEVESRFDAGLVLWNAFGYFDDDSEDVVALRSMLRCIETGGTLVVQTHGCG